MGTYYKAVCHRCRERYTASSLKLCEIALNDEPSAQVGRFLLMHNHHPVELVGDDCDWGRVPQEVVSEYRKVTDEEIDEWVNGGG